MLAGEFDKFFVLDTTSTNEDHTVSGIVRLDVRREVVTVDGENVLFGTKDRAAERLTFRSQSDIRKEEIRV